MSRIGKIPVGVPAGVEVKISETEVAAKGPKGSLSVPYPSVLKVKIEGKSVVVERLNDSRNGRAQHGLVRNLVKNMLIGVSEGYVKRLQVVGTGWGVKVEGDSLSLTVGFCNPQVKKIPDGVSVEIPAKTTTIVIAGRDKAVVGQFAAEVRKIRPPEPYQGKGIRYENEAVRRKAGKSAIGASK